MSFVPLSRSRLDFVAEEFWPGGGENDDGRDLYGVAEYRRTWREETTEADLIAAALYEDTEYIDRIGLEEFDHELETLEVDPDDSIRVNGQPLEEVVDEYDELDGEDGPGTIELQRELAMAELQIEYREVSRQRWNEREISDAVAASEPVRPTPSGPITPSVASALNRFERDGIRQIGSRRAVSEASGLESWYECRRVRDLTTWKRYRAAQYRPRYAS